MEDIWHVCVFVHAHLHIMCVPMYVCAYINVSVYNIHIFSVCMHATAPTHILTTHSIKQNTLYCGVYVRPGLINFRVLKGRKQFPKRGFHEIVFPYVNRYSKINGFCD